MVDALLWLMGHTYESQMSYRQKAIFDAQVDAQKRACEEHQRAFEEMQRANQAADPLIIDVEARIVDDVPSLPAPEDGGVPCSP